MPHQVQDAELIVTKALPAAAATANSDPIDLGAQSGHHAFLAECEFEVSIPATPDLVEAKTIIVDIQMDTVSNFASPTTLIDNLLTVTGAAAAAGGPAASARFRVPTNVERYIRAVATVLDAGGDNTAVSLTLKALF